MTGRRSAEQSAPEGVAVIGASYHHPRLPKEWRHQLVDAGPGRERVRWAGQVHGCHRSRGARRTTLCRQEGERRDAMPSEKPDRSTARPRKQWSLLRSAGSRAGAARSSAGERRVPGRSRQDRARRPWRPRRGGSERGGGEGGQGGGRSGSRPAGAAAAPRQHRSPTSCTQEDLQVSGAGGPRVTGGLTVPSAVENRERRRGGEAGGEGHAQGEHEVTGGVEEHGQAELEEDRRGRPEHREPAGQGPREPATPTHGGVVGHEQV